MKVLKNWLIKIMVRNLVEKRMMIYSKRVSSSAYLYASTKRTKNTQADKATIAVIATSGLAANYTKKLTAKKISTISLPPPPDSFESFFLHLINASIPLRTTAMMLIMNMAVPAESH